MSAIEKVMQRVVEYQTTYDVRGDFAVSVLKSEFKAALAEAWDLGYRKGTRDHCDYSGDDDCDISAPNPWRKP